MLFYIFKNFPFRVFSINVFFKFLNICILTFKKPFRETDNFLF